MGVWMRLPGRTAHHPLLGLLLSAPQRAIASTCAGPRRAACPACSLLGLGLGEKVGCLAVCRLLFQTGAPKSCRFFFFFPPAELTLTTDLQTHRPCLSRVDPGAALHHRALGVPAVQSSPLRGPMTEDGSRIAMGVPTGSALHFSLGEQV